MNPNETTALASRQPTMLETVMQAIATKGLTPEVARQYLELGRELEADQAKREWAMAFRAAKDELDGVKLTKNGRITYEGKPGKQGSTIKFLEYDDIAEAVKPILRKNGLTASYTYRYESTPPKTICVMKLLHASGHFENFESVPLPMIDQSGGKTDVQGAGSVMTYGRRYVVQGAFDIVATGQDNDGSGQGLPVVITEQQAMALDDRVAACAERDSKFPVAFERWLKAEYGADATIRTLYQGKQHTAVSDKLTEKMRAMNIR